MLSDPRMNCSIFIGYKFSCDSPVRELSEGEGIKVGDELLTVMLTPGHTADSLVFYTSSYAFTGDTLFSEGGYGRCDLPTGSTSALAASLRRIFELSDELIIYPGHGNSSSLGSTKMYF
jgi:glyoxylase-like metal-dependent hydrolase (beta-lactamase superfamily II)